MKTSTSTLVDSNILLDLFQGGAQSLWSRHALAKVGGMATLLVNQVIWSEISSRFSTVAELETALGSLPYEKQSISFDAAFVAGKAHSVYRRAGGARERTLPDFLIGAHALVAGHRLLTRDPSRYRSYFPALDIISPDTHP